MVTQTLYALYSVRVSYYVWTQCDNILLITSVCSSRGFFQQRGSDMLPAKLTSIVDIVLLLVTTVLLPACDVRTWRTPECFALYSMSV